MPLKLKPLALDAVVYEAPLRIDRRPKRRPFVTPDGTTIAPAQPRRPIVQEESYPIAGARLALDARPKPSGQPVTFDGAVPNPKT